MSFDFLAHIAEDARANSAICKKYIIKLSWSGWSYFDKDVDKRTSFFVQLSFFPRNTYGIIKRNKKNPDTNGFCLELNQDDEIKRCRFVIGVRKEKVGPENSDMNKYIEAIGTENTNWFKKGTTQNEQMKSFHWKRWCFLGDFNKFRQSSISSPTPSLKEVICDPSLTTDLKGFENLLFAWLLKY